MPIAQRLLQAEPLPTVGRTRAVAGLWALVSRLASEISKRPQLGIGLIGYVGGLYQDGNSAGPPLK